MMRGDKAGLRARHDADLPILLDELYNDIPTRSAADSRPWRPIPPDATQTPYTADSSDSVAAFSVVDLESDQLAGEGLLWGIDLHNRLAHIGISLRPSFRGNGLATDAVRLLCRYGFVVRGLQRLQIDTLAANEPMRRVAAQLGFTHEATLRRNAWVMGEFVDEVAYGLLVSEWRDGTSAE